MVSLSLLTSVLALVTFGNADVAVRYLKSSTQNAAPKGGATSVQFIDGTCPDDTQLTTNYRINCNSQPNGEGCVKMHTDALRSIITSLLKTEDISTAEGLKMRELAPLVQKFFSGYPGDRAKEDEKEQYIRDLYKYLPAAIPASLEQSNFGLKVIHPFFLARFANFFLNRCKTS
ncbi:unnamed protein product [Albugo candida]|uniref:Uncharacterized protein n=1 Tax=Albugo candida TaxID=65357 RepID=A0A024FUM9_9STRA|nr:unnamed protein product [Albugo candida]CCI11012.1 unnamed protein product [Albugo candida]|eukprot:CCI10746.1 unnamed protein product [Albugo candida]